jgi:uncharacterized protein YdaU (DUF1376 family)
MSARTKPPAFQFYPGDFLADYRVASMELAEVGAYVLLLCFDWREDGVPDDHDTLARLCRVDPITFAGYWPRLSECFIEHPKRKGHLTNPRLNRERVGQDVRRQAAIESGRRGGRQKAANERARKAAMENELARDPTKTLVGNPSSSSSSASAITSEDVSSLRSETGEPEGERPVEDYSGKELLEHGNGLIGARFAPLIREHLYAGKRPGRNWNEGRDLSIARNLLTKGVTPDTIEAAILGFRFLVDRGTLVDGWGLRRGDVLTLRPLYAADAGGPVPFFNECAHAGRKLIEREGL